ncbi:uncharacterized protein B0T15DRAFT_246520 [Chaetomium strumarium]|uniref:Uncharacterized protein n=1 Tax=Chaetomium strumarium TaxID=1170767 RepID=A0AAJ0M0K9_9PEZI|nr:hypothetical protein B0T15DRAFT_246520 [Chaetomium strumarium]
MPRKNMPSPEKRRPPVGTGPKGAGINGPRSPPRPSRTTPSSPRKGGGSNNPSNAPSSSGTFIAPPPRAALSRASSPAPASANPRNNTSSKDPAGPGPGLLPLNAPANRRSASPSPLPHLATAAASTATATATATTAIAPTITLASAQSALREKELRIASLERELALMEAEFVRELDKLSSAESDTAAFWQAKYAAIEKQLALILQAQGEEAPCMRQREKDEDEGTERERERENKARMEQELDELRGAWERTKETLARRDEEVAQLRAQVRGLKEWVSTSTRTDGQAQTSDEVFGEGMAKLGNGLQNWVLVNFRRAKVDLSSADEETISELARLVPMYEELASTFKIHLLQSVVSRLLVDLVFDAYFVGLPTNVAGQIRQVEAFLSSFASSPEWINQWRSLTLTMLKKDANEKLQTETTAVVGTVVSKVNRLLDSITNTKSSEARDQGLQALVSSAIEISRLLAVQRAVFTIEMPEILPHQRTMFDAETMEDIGGEDEDSLADRDICCITFPGIIKRGDESGGHLQYRNVISKAKVICSPE